MESLTASVSFTGSVPRLRVTRHTASSTARIGGEQDPLAQATVQLANFKSTYPDSETSEDESREIDVAGASSRLLSASLPPPDSSTHSSDTTHRLRALLNRIDNSSRNPMTEPRVVMPPSPSEPESDFDLRPAQVARASIKDLFQNALRDPGDSISGSLPAILNVELRERLKENERERQHELERSWNRPHSRVSQSTPHLHEKPDLHSHIPRSGSSPEQSHEDVHHRLHSRSVHDRPRSTSPSFSTSHREEASEASEASEDGDVVDQERERNWKEGETTPKITPLDDLPTDHTQANGYTSATPAPPGAYRVTPTPVNRERQHELEHSWNRPHSRNSQFTPHLHEKPDLHSHIPRSGSSPEHLHEDLHHRLPSRSVHDRPRSTSPPSSTLPPSPASPSSSTSSISHREEALEDEHMLEQEREWNRKESETTPKIKPLDDLLPIHTQTNGYTSATPAPPGAYRVTPMPAKRKGILKVRFEGNAQTPEDIIENPFAGVVTGNNRVNGTFSHSSSSEDDVPPLSLSPSRRKGLRLVDEYGRARRFTEDGEEIILDTRRKNVNGGGSLVPAVPDDSTMTPRRRAKMRQVDAMGNDVTGSAESKFREEQNEEVPEPRRKKTVLSRLAKSLEELQDDLAEEENALAASVPASALSDGERMLDLATVSKAARVERDKLSHKLQLERHAEDGITDKIFVARNPRRDLHPWETTDRASWWQRKWRLVIIILILELTLLYMGYRVAMMHAKHIWLKTHFDPFFPALYLHPSRPTFLSRFGSLPRGWSTFAIPGPVQGVGVRGFLKVWEDIWKWRLEPWGAWGNPAAGPPVPRPWPS